MSDVEALVDHAVEFDISANLFTVMASLGPLKAFVLCEEQFIEKAKYETSQAVFCEYERAKFHGYDLEPMYRNLGRIALTSDQHVANKLNC